MMTDNEMRVAIAEYRFPQFPIVYENGRPRHQYPHRNNETGPVDPIDLETMHVVEEELPELKRATYLEHLWNLNPSQLPATGLWNSTHANAKQRATAFCMTLFPERFKE